MGRSSGGVCRYSLIGAECRLNFAKGEHHGEAGIGLSHSQILGLAGATQGNGGEPEQSDHQQREENHQGESNHQRETTAGFRCRKQGCDGKPMECWHGFFVEDIYDKPLR